MSHRMMECSAVGRHMGSVRPPMDVRYAGGGLIDARTARGRSRRVRLLTPINIYAALSEKIEVTTFVVAVDNFF